MIRGIDAVNGELLNEVQFIGPGGQVVWANGFGGTVGFDYASYRGRFVIEEGTTFTLHSTMPIDISVWGYELTAP